MSDTTAVDIVDKQEGNAGNEAPTSNADRANDAAQKVKKQRNGNRRTPDLSTVLKSMQSCSNDAERFEALKNSYDALYRKYDSFKEKHVNCKSTEQENLALKKECDILRVELTKSQQVKARLETLCRELQKTNRDVREEAIASSKRDEDRRNEVSAKFSATINEVQVRSNDIMKRNAELETERVEYASKLDGLIADYTKIQSDINEKETRWRAHEDALIKQLECERALSTQEKHVLMTQLEVEKHKLGILEARESELHTQLKTYATRYEEIESSMRQSAETVTVFRAEISKASKAIKTIQKENESLKNANMQLALDKLELERQKQITEVKMSRLENLCRAMQKMKLGDAEAKPEDETKKTDSNSNGASADHSRTDGDNAATTEAAGDTPQQSTDASTSA